MRHAPALLLLLIAAPADAKPSAPLAAAAKACALPAARLTPTEAPTDRVGPADAHELDTDRWYFVGDDRVTLTDDTGDHRADSRAREIAKPGDPDTLDCRIDERWSHGRWHLVTVARYEGVEEIVTTFRNDRAARVERRSAITQ